MSGKETTRVLVIDDEQDFAFFVKKNLESHGKFEVSVCDKASRALERVKTFKPDVVLLDMMMPERSGEEIAADLREEEETESVPIVFLTALVREEETSTNEHVIGGHFFVSKPVKIDELIAVIRRAMG